MVWFALIFFQGIGVEVLGVSAADSGSRHQNAALGVLRRQQRWLRFTISPHTYSFDDTHQDGVLGVVPVCPGGV